MSLYVAIVGHVSRTTQAAELARTLAPATLHLDDGSLGEWGNHRQALSMATAGGKTHVLVLQDDAVPVPDLLVHAAAAVEQRPNDLISLYVGKLRPLAPLVTRAVDHARETEASWLSHERLLWGVGFILPTHAIRPVVRTADDLQPVPTDRRLGMAWRKTQSRDVLYTWPSLVDHADGEQVTTDHPTRPRGRVAHEVGIPCWGETVVAIA